ncbi:MAG TPA: DUF3127 domain-containing protein [Candidatus Tidjanibacter faecipullorum]|uniref:DUF3127 domain-containing protein n=1 Tax=Candidatus Tidjanibacter faecipullorum TaxID=2838766 RepID=A0A9D2IM79_9BACT|nr:DUF3127 domain-containing protein [Candidatus Tidjanibacter faecipullorum]
MEFEGIVYKVLPVVKGTSQRGEWVKQEVVFELPGEFNRKLCVGFWGDKAQDAGNLKPGEKVSVSINLESREYNGRWYTEARAWRLTRQAAQPAAAPMPDMPPFAEEEPYANDPADDLPF